MPIGANVELELVCLSKKEGGLGLKVLEVEEWDKVTMSRRIGPSAIKLTSFGSNGYTFVIKYDSF